MEGIFLMLWLSYYTLSDIIECQRVLKKYSSIVLGDKALGVQNKL